MYASVSVCWSAVPHSRWCYSIYVHAATLKYRVKPTRPANRGYIEMFVRTARVCWTVRHGGSATLAGRARDLFVKTAARLSSSPSSSSSSTHRAHARAFRLKENTSTANNWERAILIRNVACRRFLLSSLRQRAHEMRRITLAIWSLECLSRYTTRRARARAR